MLENSEEAELDSRHAVAESQFWSSSAARPPTSACFRSPLASSVLRGWSAQTAEAAALTQVASFTQTHFRGFGFHVAPEEQKKAPVVETRTGKLQVYMCV